MKKNESKSDNNNAKYIYTFKICGNINLIFSAFTDLNN